METKRIPVIMPLEHHESLRKLAFDDRTSIAEHIRIAIKEYLERKESEGK